MAEIRVPFTDTLFPCQSRCDEIQEELRQVLCSGGEGLQLCVEALEREFGLWLSSDDPLAQMPHTLGVASGTDALELALRGFFSLNPDVAPRGQGGQCETSVVFAPSHGPVALASAIERAGGVPVLVDVDPLTYTLSPSSLADAVDLARENGCVPAAVVALHSYGHPCDMRMLELVAQDAGLWILEDCAYALGAEYRQRRVGTLSEAAAFSCYPQRNLGALGDAGLLCTGFLPLADELDSLRHLGGKSRRIAAVPGVNSSLDPLEAAVLRVNLRHLDADLEERARIARRYTEAFLEGPVLPPTVASWAKHAWNMYMVRVPGRVHRRNELMDFLQQQGVGVSQGGPLPLHLQPAYSKRLLLAPGGLPETLALSEQLLPLPLYPGMSEEQVDYVIDAVRRWRG